MGKLKVRDWRYKSLEVKPSSLAVKNAAVLANYKLKKKQKALEILAVDEAVRETREKDLDDITNQWTDWDLGCAALVLHRRYGYDADECGNFLTAIQDLVREFQEADMDHKKIWDVVRDEIGLDISYEE